MFKKILVRSLIALVVIIAVFVAVVATRPAQFRVERSTTVAASQADAFAQVDDFHKWEAWSPWLKVDPNATSSFEGPSEGKGAVFRWAGNDEVGEGSMTITESRPNDLVRIRLDFLKPFAGTSTAEFTFKPEGDQTKVTWSMFGENNFIAKAISLFIDCDKMIGDKFEEGLANMKSVLETPPKEET